MLASELDSMVTRLENINVVDSVVADAELKADIDDGKITTEEDKTVEDIPHNHPDDKSQSSQTSSTSNNSIIFEQPPPEILPDMMMDAKAQRKVEKKRKKSERRAQREGKGDPTAGE